MAFSSPIPTNRLQAVRSELFSSGLRLFCTLLLLWYSRPITHFAQTRDTTTQVIRTFQPVQTMMQQPISTSATRTTAATMTKDPIVAVALSLIPGLGQIYVESYWKAPIFLAGFGTAIGFTIYNSNLVTQADKILADSTQSRTVIDIVTRQREVFRDLRDISIVAIVGVIGLAAIDAYVGAHLFDFDVSDEFKAALRINPLQGRIHLSIRQEAQENEQERIMREALLRTKP